MFQNLEIKKNHFPKSKYQMFQFNLISNFISWIHQAWSNYCMFLPVHILVDVLLWNEWNLNLFSYYLIVNKKIRDFSFYWSSVRGYANSLTVCNSTISFMSYNEELRIEISFLHTTIIRIWTVTAIP